MTKAQAIEQAAELFSSYPTVNEFHFTTDKQAFAIKQNAESHAVSLDKKEPKVVTVSRDEVLTEEKPAKKTAAAKADAGTGDKSAEQIAVDAAAEVLKKLKHKLKFAKAENKPAVQAELDAAQVALDEATAKLPS